MTMHRIFDNVFYKYNSEVSEFFDYEMDSVVPEGKLTDVILKMRLI